MLGGDDAGLFLREAHRHDPRCRHQFHHVHAGYTAACQHASRAFGAVETGQQNAPRLVPQVVANQLLLFLDVIVKITDQHFQAARAHDFVNGLKGFDEQLVGQRRDQHHHRLALRRRQGSGRRVGDITQAQRGLLDLFHQVRGNSGDTAQGAGSGDGGNPGKTGNFRQGGASGSTRADAGHGFAYFRLAKNRERALR
ncbi:hypothetical protein D9M73_206210 [compost metagenome]